MIESSERAVIDPLMAEVKRSNLGCSLTVGAIEVGATVSDILNLTPVEIFGTLFLQKWTLVLTGRNIPPRYHHVQLFAKNDEREIYIGAATGDVQVIVITDLDDSGAVKYVYSDMVVPTPTGKSYLQVKRFDIN